MIFILSKILITYPTGKLGCHYQAIKFRHSRKNCIERANKELIFLIQLPPPQSLNTYYVPVNVVGAGNRGEDQIHFLPSRSHLLSCWMIAVVSSLAFPTIYSLQGSQNGPSQAQADPGSASFRFSHGSSSHAEQKPKSFPVVYNSAALNCRH